MGKWIRVYAGSGRGGSTGIWCRTGGGLTAIDAGLLAHSRHLEESLEVSDRRIDERWRPSCSRTLTPTISGLQSASAGYPGQPYGCKNRISDSSGAYKGRLWVS